METQNTTEQQLMRAIKQYLYELKKIGYEQVNIKEAIYKLRKRNTWKTRVTKILHYIDDQLY